MIEYDNRPGESSAQQLPDRIAESSVSAPLASPASSNGYTRQPDDLHDLFGTANGDDEDPLAALRDDPNYSALIKDLEYIASQARLLFEPAAEAPSDDVWTKIQSKLNEPGDDVE
jgi:hypothetical protein